MIIATLMPLHMLINNQRLASLLLQIHLHHVSLAVPIRSNCKLEQADGSGPDVAAAAEITRTLSPEWLAVSDAAVQVPEEPWPKPSRLQVQVNPL